MIPSYRYTSPLLSIRCMIPVIRRITATRAIFTPRFFLIPRYQVRSFESFRTTCTTTWPSRNRTIRLPCLVIEPKRSFSPLLREPGVRPKKFARLRPRGNRRTSPIRLAIAKAA